MKKIRLLLTGLLLVVTAAVYAQDIQVKGTVIDVTTGQPVIGADVQLKGSNVVYTMTDADGNYVITAPSAGTLIFNFLGFKTTEIPIGGKTLINVSLEPEAESLDDVIVVAYGTVSREAKTGSVSSVKGDKIGELPVTSVDKMLQGKMAGVSISSNSGQPGATSSIRIRGTSSINAGNEPLWVVDGIPMDAGDAAQLSNVGVGGGTTMSAINPNDIESITVLKDAAAASIYGSRAANGVILVTTKSGKQGVSKFSVRAKFGGSFIANDNGYDVMSGQQLLDYQRVAAINAGVDPDDPNGKYYRPLSLLDGEITNWQKHLSRTGLMQEYEVNATGGNSKGTYYSSLAYHKNQGVYYGVDLQRFTARLNADYNLLKTLKTGTRINLSYSDQNAGQMGQLFYSNPVFASYNILPWTPAYNEDGSHNVNISENSDTNPRATAEYDEYNDKQYRIQGNMYLEYKPIKQLSIKTTNAVDANFINSRQFWSAQAHKGEATLFSYRTQTQRYTTSNTITYNDIYNDVHSFRLMVGQEAMFETFNYLGAKSPKVDPLIPFPNTSSAADDAVYYGDSAESLMSFLAIADYNYDSKYFIQASARYDGSSLFGANNKWGLFWSAAASWNIHNEEFLKSVKWINTLKLRLSYGVNGNNNIARYRAYGVYGSSEYAGFMGMLPTRPSNPDLSWEKNKTWNVGVDFGFINRINGSIEFYDRITDDMLLSKRVPQTTGFTTNLVNIGSLRNRGVEFQLDADIFRTNEFLWNVGVNMAFNRTKVLDLAGNEFITATDSRSDDTGPVRIVEGKSLYNFYIRDWYGVNPSNGDGLWYDKEGKLTNDRTKARYTYAGSPEPKFTGGFNTTLSWKGISLSAFFEFVYGNKVLVSNMGTQDGYSMTSNQLTYALDYWEKPGDTATNPRPVAGNPGLYHVGYSTRFLQDGSYLRIRDITLSYQLPESVLRKMKMQGIKLYVSAQNPYTFHDVKAYDPELGPLGFDTGASYSQTKNVIGGIEITF